MRNIGIVCALKCEADPLIHHFQLKKWVDKRAYPIFYNDSIFLVISGVGKLHSAGATAYLGALMEEEGAWINVGIAGHRSKEVGEGALVHQIEDESSGRFFYPAFPWKPTQPTVSLKSVDRVETRCEEGFVYEMEASGFYQSASRLSTVEWIHCYKIISDNERQAPSRDADYVRELVGAHITKIVAVVEELHSLQKHLSDASALSDPIEPFLERWHFTSTQVHMLRRQLQCWRALHPGVSIWDAQAEGCRKARDLLSYLGQKCFS